MSSGGDSVTLTLKILMADGDEISAPYLVRIGGWAEEQYFREASETRIVEFEDGEVIVHSPAGIRHQLLTAFLAMLLRGYVRSRRLGEILGGPAVVRLRPGLNYEPDIFFVPLDKLSAMEEEYFAGAPALIVEVISRGTRTHDLKTKASAYQEHGVREYWAVDPERQTLTRHLLPPQGPRAYRVSEHSQSRLESEAIRGFWLNVSWLWQDPLPEELRCLQQILSA
jgi:Uma2 family endonuclease